MGNPKIGNQGIVPVLAAQPIPSGLLQADFVYQEDVDSGHPLNLDYFIPINCQTVKTARLSFRLRLYRTYSTFTAGSTTGGESVTHSHAHSTTHAHSIPVGGVAGAFALFWNGAASGVSSNAAGGNTTDINARAPGATDVNTVDHTHTISGSSVLGVVEDVNNNPSYTVSFDGVDQTVNLIPAGPYTSDQVEIDVTKFISTKVDRAWHTISLGPTARGRIQAVLRVLYNSNQV